MKIIKLVIVFVLAINFVSAQTVEKDSISNFVEVMPQFPGGEKEMMKFIYKNLQYPSDARENNIMGKVVVQFVVEKDGSIDEFKILKSVGGGCDEEVLRILKLMPQWTPAMQNNKVVSCYFNLPVTFMMADGNGKEKKKKN